MSREHLRNLLVVVGEDVVVVDARNCWMHVIRLQLQAAVANVVVDLVEAGGEAGVGRDVRVASVGPSCPTAAIVGVQNGQLYHRLHHHHHQDDTDMVVEVRVVG